MSGVEKICGSRVLVAGGSGFIGRHLVHALVSLKCSVVSLSGKAPVLFPSAPGVRQIVADIRARDSLKEALKGEPFDFVINAGGYIDHTPYFRGGRDVMEQHYSGVLNLIDCLDRDRLKGFVQVGSSDEYGNAPAPQAEDMKEQPISPYSAAKVAATYFIKMLSATESFPGTVVRFFLVYGPGQDSRRFLPQIIQSCLRGTDFDVSEGKQLRDFCYIADAVDGLILAATTDAARGSVLNIASGSPVSIRSMTGRINQMIGMGTPLYGRIPYRPGENMALYADISMAKALLGWEPRTSLEEGLERTIQWYRERLEEPHA